MVGSSTFLNKKGCKATLFARTAERKYNKRIKKVTPFPGSTISCTNYRPPRPHRNSPAFWLPPTRPGSDSIPLTTFGIKYGHSESFFLLFGLSNVHATFMGLMNSILAQYKDRFVLVYLNDIPIYSDSEQEHLYHAIKILEILKITNYTPKNSNALSEHKRQITLVLS